MDTIFTTENSQPTKTLADYINEGKSFLEAYQAQSPKRLARGKAYEQVEMLKELLNLLHQPDNTEVQQVTDVLIPKTYPENMQPAKSLLANHRAVLRFRNPFLLT